MLNADQLAVLAAELADARYSALLAAQDYEAIAALLNVQPDIANPQPRPNVPQRFTWDTFIDLLTPQEVLGMYGYGNFAADLRRALESNDQVELVALWRGAKTALAAATVTKVETEFNKTQPDPDWQATVLGPSRATELGLPRILPQDVQAVEQGNV